MLTTFALLVVALVGRARGARERVTQDWLFVPLLALIVLGAVEARERGLAALPRGRSSSLATRATRSTSSTWLSTATRSSPPQARHRHPRSSQAVLAGMAIVVALASLTFLLVERRARRWLKARLRRSGPLVAMPQPA
jgi:peptidoglycan/LPS O-acetylase OafA/YrhL